MKPENKKQYFHKHLDMEEASVVGFCNFCRNNLPLVLAVSVTLFFAYGIRLFCHSIGIDTELFMADRTGTNQVYIEAGRFGQVLLSNIWRIGEFNPFTGFFIAFCLIWVFTLSWSYIIAIFGMNTDRNNALIPFALLFMTVPIWAEQFYFLPQAAENAFIIALCPYVVYLMYKGFLDNEKGKIIGAVLLLVLMTSVYQAIVPLFICGVFICFILLQEHSNYELKIYRNLCLKLFTALVAAMTIYFVVGMIIVPTALNIERGAYLDGMNRWGRQPLGENIRNILAFGYAITIGHIPFVHEVLTTRLADFGPTLHRVNPAQPPMVAARTLFLLPVAVFFLVKVIAFMRKEIPSGRKFLFILASIGIPLSIAFLAILGGNVPPSRSLYSLPLAYAFMFFYLIKSSKRPTAVVLACFALFGTVYQAQTTAQLFYSDRVRFNEDVRIAHELNNLIMQVQPSGEKLPVALVGRYGVATRFHEDSNFLQGQAIGHSFFDGDGPHLFAPTKRALIFMSTLGIFFEMPTRDQLVSAHEEAKLMPSFPALGSVKRTQDFIVVRLSYFHN